MSNPHGKYSGGKYMAQSLARTTNGANTVQKILILTVVCMSSIGHDHNNFNFE